MNYTDEDRDGGIEERTGVIFNNKDLLHRALIHRSYLNENPQEKESNERLEFLGDAVLEFVVSEHLFGKFVSEDEGHLTALRAKLVNTISLAEVGRQMNLGQALYFARGEELGEGRKNTTLLANAVEALIGAIFMDKGIEEVAGFIDRFILKKIPDIVKKSLKDPKSLLQEYVQAAGLPTPIYKIISDAGAAHLKTFIVEVVVDKKSLAKGSGPSKKIATQKAASAALASWSKGR